ncbi:hypothetical protein LCGC14_1064850 [marine sediment metagenome]|uniref:Uncharacterized protein n=1 Tax=marine sediment metagenome TaxID=412755 RepID=A0A0F9MPQ5_9ZZZZ|nr:hypothetical protein [Pricia sp.]
MAGVATSKINLKVTGLGDTIESNPDLDATTLTVPTERSSDYIIVSTATTTALQISDLAPSIALAKMDALYIKAEVGTIYVSLDTSGTTSITSATAQMALTVGKDILIHLNQGGNLGVVIDASAVTDAFSYILTGTA